VALVARAARALGGEQTRPRGSDDDEMLGHGSPFVDASGWKHATISGNDI
jgi:hypothetical protein